MQCARAFIVQDAETCGFLAPDGEGGVIVVRLLANARPFLTEEAASEAVADHLGGQGYAVPVWVPVE